ncbi:hypothetical protein T11_7671 [Trichinella zimbabwensis]|uniref:Uncharacterized protein n=1 Tax=Trichinella zimbabwensis TaxID=268475 RepID=A0A0V1G8D1_9BILA|nr:hypothetical protein T11_7671 [Trichinella zimbabwensis]
MNKEFINSLLFPRGMSLAFKAPLETVLSLQ